MHCVSQITPHLHVGGQYNRRGWAAMTQRGITAVIDMRIEFDDRETNIAPGSYLYLPVVDDEPPSLEQLSEGIRFLDQVMAAGGSVYVHCSAGVGRAPTMAAAYLVSIGMTPAEAWETIRIKRPFIRPKPAQVAQVERFASQRRSSSQ